jgi:hypothetical protein
MTVLDAADLVKRYKRTTAVDGVSLTVDADERDDRPWRTLHLFRNRSSITRYS